MTLSPNKGKEGHGLSSVGIRMRSGDLGHTTCHPRCRKEAGADPRGRLKLTGVHSASLVPIGERRHFGPYEDMEHKLWRNEKCGDDELPQPDGFDRLSVF